MGIILWLTIINNTEVYANTTHTCETEEKINVKHPKYAIWFMIGETTQI